MNKTQAQSSHKLKKSRKIFLQLKEKDKLCSAILVLIYFCSNELPILEKKKEI